MCDFYNFFEKIMFKSTILRRNSEVTRAQMSKNATSERIPNTDPQQNSLQNVFLDSKSKNVFDTHIMIGHKCLRSFFL